MVETMNDWTRAEWLEIVKRRARVELERGSARDACLSALADLAKHRDGAVGRYPCLGEGLL